MGDQNSMVRIGESSSMCITRRPWRERRLDRGVAIGWCVNWLVRSKSAVRTTERQAQSVHTVDLGHKRSALQTS